MSNLTISQLFTPTPSGVIPGVTPLTTQSATWLYTILQNGSNLNLNVTAWDSSGVAWTVEKILAALLSTSDGLASLRAQGAFLDFAATGTVTYTDYTQSPPVSVTVPVTPDPSIAGQNPTGALGWLDVLADGTYNTQRTPASYATNSLYVVNTTGSSVGTYTSGTFHVADGATGSTYKNQPSFTFGASSTAGGAVVSLVITGPAFTPGGVAVTTTSAHGLSIGSNIYVYGLWGTVYTTPTATSYTFTWDGTRGTVGGSTYLPTAVTFTADTIGPVSNAAPGSIRITTTSVPGCAVNNFDAFTGNPWQSNISLAAQCRSALSAASPNGAKGAYEVYALKAGTILAAQTPPKTLTQSVTRVLVSQNYATGTVTVTVANASGPVPGISNLILSAASNATPIVLTVQTGSSTVALSSSMVVLVSGVQGNTAANGYWPITVLTGTTFSLTGSVGNGSYTEGGVVEAGDLGLVDSVIQAYSDPNAVTALTQSASALSVSLSATVYVPVQYLAAYGPSGATNLGALAFVGLVGGLPIGGTTIPGNTNGVVDVSQVEDALFDAGTSAGRVYTISVQNILLNGVPQSTPVGANQVATAGAINVTVVGV